MAKSKIDFKSLEIPAVAKTPLYAGVGAGDLAVTAVLEYVADVQKKLTDVQKSVTDFDAKKLRDSALEQAAARRAAVESRVAELQAEAKALPTKSQTVALDYVGTVTGTYADLAKRGEALVTRVRKQESTKATKTAAKTTTAKAKTTTTQAKKATSTTAKKTTTAAKKTASAAKKAAAPAKSSAKATTTAAKKTATKAAEATTEAAAKVGD